MNIKTFRVMKESTIPYACNTKDELRLSADL